MWNAVSFHLAGQPKKSNRGAAVWRAEQSRERGWRFSEEGGPRAFQIYQSGDMSQKLGRRKQKYIVGECQQKQIINGLTEWCHLCLENLQYSFSQSLPKKQMRGLASCVLELIAKPVQTLVQPIPRGRARRLKKKVNSAYVAFGLGKQVVQDRAKSGPQNAWILQASWGRNGRQHQEQNSPNRGQLFWPTLVDNLLSY